MDSSSSVLRDCMASANCLVFEMTAAFVASTLSEACAKDACCSGEVYFLRSSLYMAKTSSKSAFMDSSSSVCRDSMASANCLVFEMTAAFAASTPSEACAEDACCSGEVYFLRSSLYMAKTSSKSAFIDSLSSVLRDSMASANCLVLEMTAAFAASTPSEACAKDACCSGEVYFLRSSL